MMIRVMQLTTVIKSKNLDLRVSVKNLEFSPGPVAQMF